MDIMLDSRPHFLSTGVYLF